MLKGVFMLFPLSIIEPCLERIGVPVEVPPDWALRTFSYASSDAPTEEPGDPQASSARESGDGEQVLSPRKPNYDQPAPSAYEPSGDQQTLLVVPYECALKLAHGKRTRPLLAIASPEAAGEQGEFDASGMKQVPPAHDTSETKQTTAACSTTKAEHASTAQGSPGAFPIAFTSLSPAAVCSAINRHLIRIREWDAEMSRLVLHDCSTQQLIELGEELLGEYIALSDALYARVAATPHFPPLDDMSRALIETGSYPTSMIPTIERLAQDQRWHAQNKSHLDQGGNAINPLPNMSRVYRLGGNYAAHLVMVSSDSITPWQQFLFDLLADQVGICLDRFWQTTLPSHEKGAAFLSSIMSDNIHDPYDFKEKARLFDLPIEGVFEIAVIAGAEECGGVAHIAHQIRTGLQACRTVIADQRIYVLMISAKRSSKKIAAMEEALFEAVSRLKARIGLSSRFDLLEYCHMGRMEADVALEYGQKNFSKYLALQSSEPFIDCVFRFNRYFPCYLVDPYADTAEFLAKYAASPNIVSRLRRADAENGTNDFGLLKIYLYFDCSVKKTAELMNMHRNTVVYRLNKIKTDYRLDLDNCDTRLFLHYLFGVLD